MTAFGPDFFAPNLGLLYTATLFYFGIIMIVSQVAEIIEPMSTFYRIFSHQIPALFDLMGYSGMFVMAGVFGLLGILVTCFMPQDIRCEMIIITIIIIPIITVSYERENKRAREETREEILLQHKSPPSLSPGPRVAAISEVNKST